MWSVTNKYMLYNLWRIGENGEIPVNPAIQDGLHVKHMLTTGLELDPDSCYIITKSKILNLNIIFFVSS